MHLVLIGTFAKKRPRKKIQNIGNEMQNTDTQQDKQTKNIHYNVLFFRRLQAAKKGLM